MNFTDDFSYSTLDRIGQGCYAVINRIGQKEKHMYEAFEKLPQEKKDNVLNAAFSCFAKNGYDKASIADIAKAANISKASVFHYFGSKKNLYLYLYNMALEVIIGGITYGMKETSSDFFERIMQAQELKMKVMAQYKGMYDFLYTTVNEDEPEIRSVMDEMDDGYKKSGFGTLLENIDWSRFKSGINAEMVVNTVTWVSEGYIRQAVALDKPVEVMTKEVYKYMDLIKKSMYKEEFL